MRMTNEQLIDAAHKAAKYLPPTSAQLMSDLATRLDVALVAARTACAERNELEPRCAVLAAENLFIHDVLVRLARARPGGCNFDEWDALVADALNHPATDAFLAAVRARAHKEGAYFVANRMLAAWEAGFIEDTAKNAADIARMILTSTEFMAGAPEGDFDRSFTDGVLEDIATQLRQEAK